jgi:hypothetical protein
MQFQDQKAIYDLHARQSQKQEQHAFTSLCNIIRTGQPFRYLSRHLTSKTFQDKRSFRVTFATLGVVKQPRVRTLAKLSLLSNGYMIFTTNLLNWTSQARGMF